jgi:hypothetical protein
MLIVKLLLAKLLNCDSVVAEFNTTDTTQWSWRKWKSGIVECWRLVTISSMTWNTYPTGLYYGNVSFSFPFDVYEPLIYANVRRASTNVGWVANVNYSTSTSFTLTIVRNGNTGDISAQVYVKGRWK